MLRGIFVLILVLAGALLALRGPFYALLFYLWYAYFRPDLWMWGGWADLLQRIDLSFYIGAYTVVVTLFTRQKLRFDLHVLLLLLFVLQALVSSLLSAHGAFCLVFTKDLAIRLLIAYLIAVLATNRARYRLVLLVMGLSLAFEGAKQGWAQMFLRPGMPHTEPMPFLGDNNAVALGMLMLIPVLAVLAQTTPRLWARAGYLFLLIGVLYRALATYSRGGFVAGGALAAIYWWRSKRKLLSLLILLVLAGLAATLMPTSFWQRMETTLTYEQQEEQSALGRLHFWQVAFEMANSRPLIGVGPGAYSLEYDRYDWSLGEFGTERAVHSSWFGMLAELGYPGLLLYLGILILAFGNCRQVHRLVRQGLADAELALFASALEAGLVAWVVASSFLGVPQMELPYHYVGLTMALRGLALGRQTDREAGPRPVPLSGDPGASPDDGGGRASESAAASGRSRPRPDGPRRASAPASSA